MQLSLIEKIILDIINCLNIPESGTLHNNPDTQLRPLLQSPEEEELHEVLGLKAAVRQSQNQQRALRGRHPGLDNTCLRLMSQHQESITLLSQNS